MEQFFHIGTVTSPHGIRGEVKVYPTTDDPGRFLKLSAVILGADDPSSGRTVPVLGARLQKNMVLLKLGGVDDRDAAEALRGTELYVSRKDAVPLSENEYYIADLVGMEVFTDSGKLGILREVMQTGANDVYVVDSPLYGEILIPAIKDCIMNVDVQAGRMEVSLLPGLAEEKNKKHEGQR